MGARQWIPRLLRRGARRARWAAAELGPACRRLADRLAYRPREIVVVTLLAAGLCGGLAVERWRTRDPETAERLEAEPPRMATAEAAPPTPRFRPRPVPRCEAPGGDARSGRWPTGSAGSPAGLDLNRATPGELARVAGISWGLAARIIAARDALEPPGPERWAGPRGRGAGFRRWAPTAPALPVEPAPPPSSPPDPESLDGSSDAPPP